MHAVCNMSMSWLCTEQRAIEARSARGLPSEESDPMCVPLEWIPRFTLSLGCGTSTSSAKRLAFASAAVFMPVVSARVCIRSRKSACECACVCYVPATAETCMCKKTKENPLRRKPSNPGARSEAVGRKALFRSHSLCKTCTLLRLLALFS